MVTLMAEKLERRTTKARGMDAVLERTKEFGKPPKKRPVLRKKGANTEKMPGKGPGMTVMIAVGMPKKNAKDAPMPMRGERPKSKEDVLARMEARIAELEAKLAKYEDEESESEEGAEHDMGYEDEED
jgi:hypothetical protein